MARRCSTRAQGAFPLRQLRDRITRSQNGQEAPEWMRYLPARLQPEFPAASAQPPVAKTSPVRRAADDTPELPSTDVIAEDAPIAGNVWELSQHPVGCRRVQMALDDAESDREREAMVHELRGRVLQAARCPHANHVLQKAIASLRPKALQFIVDELDSASVGPLARHKYGCRIVQRVVEHLYPEQVHPLVEALFETLPMLAIHPYGNYIVQVVLQHGSEDHRKQILNLVVKNLRGLGAERYGSAVVGAALVYAPGDDSERIASALAKEPGLLEFLASHHGGGTTVVRALDALREPERGATIHRLLPQMDAIRVSAGGEQVAAYLAAERDALAWLKTCATAGA